MEKLVSLDRGGLPGSQETLKGNSLNSLYLTDIIIQSISRDGSHPQIDSMYFGSESGEALSLRRISLTTWMYPEKLEVFPHLQEIEVFVKLGAERKARCLRLEKGNLDSCKHSVHSNQLAHSLRTEIPGVEFTIYFCVTDLFPSPTEQRTYSQDHYDELLQTIKGATPDRSRDYFFQVLGIGDANSNKRGLLTACGDLLLKKSRQTMNIHDVTNTIFAFELAFKLVPSGDPEYLIYMQDIAVSYLLRYRLAAYASDLDQAISGFETVVDGTPTTHRGMPIWLNNLSISLENRYKRTRHFVDLNKAIDIQRRVLKLSPKGHPAIPGRLNNLGMLLHYRFEHSENLVDLADSSSSLDEAIRLTPNRSSDMPVWLENKGMVLLGRFKKSRELADIEQAMRVCQKAVDLTPEGDLGLPQRLHHLGHSYHGHFEIRGNLEDINKAIKLKERGISLANKNHPNRAQWFDSLAASLLRRFPRTENLEDINHAIFAQQLALDVSPDAAHTNNFFNNMAASLVHRYVRTGDLNDLNEAILAQHKSIQFIDSQPNHPRRLALLKNLGIHLSARFKRTHVLTDIDDAIGFHRDVVRLTDEKDPEMHSRMDGLSIALATRYQFTRQLSDLEDAISAARQAVKLARLNNPADLPTILGHLGPILLCSFDRENRLEDLEEAIHKTQEAISLLPDGHIAVHLCSLNLSHCLRRRFNLTRNIADINEAITILQKTIDLSSEMIPEMCTILDGLGHAFASRYKHSNERQDLDMAITKHRAAAMYPIGTPIDRITAARHWAARANVIDPQQTMDGLGMSIELLSQVAGLEQTIEERYTIISDTKHLSPAAAAIAIKNGRYGLALEWLEQSRCLVWTQVNRLRAPIDELRHYDEELAKDLLKVSRALEVSGARQTLSMINATTTVKLSNQSQVNLHLKHSREWDRLLLKIRTIPQFQDFLRPPRTLNLLKNLPKTGFVVIINISKERCDVLALFSGADTPQHIPLPGFSYDLAEDLRKRLGVYLIRNGVQTRNEEELKLRAGRLFTDPLDDRLLSEILRILWLYVVEPIFKNLGIPCRPSEPTRVWWCATGPLVSLPLHAAGIYGKDSTGAGSCVSDFAIPSYTPTLSALIDRVNNSRSIEEENQGLLLISQPKTPGLSPLPGTTEETQLVGMRLKEDISRVKCLDGDAATIERVMNEMHSHSCIHLACHAVQGVEPLDSGFYLHDGRLELTEIIKRQFPNADLAFLSACQTSTGVDILSEELVHLAAGMLAAGYQGVVATMWSIKDSYGPVVAEDFYQELRKIQTEGGSNHESISSRGAASALHYSTKQLRESLDDSESSLLIWVPYVHFGL